MVDTADSVIVAMKHIAKCSFVAVGCGGFDQFKSGQISVVQVSTYNCTKL